LAEGWIETLERFSRYSVKKSCASPLIDLVDAEIAFRDGMLDQAQTLGISASDDLPAHHSLKARGYTIAGTAALIQTRLPEALRLQSLALDVATAAQDIDDARWGRWSCMVYLEGDQSAEAVNELNALQTSSTDDRLRALSAELLVRRLGSGFRTVHLEGVARQIERSSNPNARTSSGNVCSYILALQARYGEAATVIDSSLADAATYRLSFAIPHLQATKALIELGLRHFSRADRCLREVEVLAQATDSLHLELNARSLRARLLLTHHRISEAVGVASHTVDHMPTKGMYGEYIATRALCLAIADDHKTARALLDEARQITSVVEVTMLSIAAEAITFLGKRRGNELPARALQMAIDLDAWDGLVCAMRAAPKLLHALVRDEKARLPLARVLVRSRDVSLLRSAGLRRYTNPVRGNPLSARERDVIELMGQGLTNKEIGETLFISTSTAKVHVEHILQKLRVRTRAQAVARYAADEANLGR
jgi:DNA-binding NarL/FixJ family response regulator